MRGAGFAKIDEGLAAGRPGGGPGLPKSGASAANGVSVIIFTPLTLSLAGGAGLSFSLISTISRSGLESCEAVKVTGGLWGSRSSTTRVTPGCVSATRICLSKESPTGTTCIPFSAMAGRAPWMSKNSRSGSDNRSERYLKSEETSMETRVTSPSDQKRTEVTFPAVAAAANTPGGSSASAAITAQARRLLRRSEMQSAIGVDKLLQLRVLLLFAWYCLVWYRVLNCSRWRRGGVLARHRLRRRSLLL